MLLDFGLSLHDPGPDEEFYGRTIHGMLPKIRWVILMR
jgi:hypothetical protein